FLARFSKLYSSNKLFYVLSIALLFNTLNCWGWVGINSGKRSADKIRDMVIDDPGYYYNAYLANELELTVIFQRAGLIDYAIEASELGYKKYIKTKPQAIYNYSTMLLIKGDTNKAITVLESMIHYFPMAYGNFEELTTLYERKHMNEKAYRLSVGVMKLYLRYPAQVSGHTDKAYLPHILKVVHENALTLHDTLAYKYSTIILDSLNKPKTLVPAE
ncbi:MAG TPA: hypothetical protein VNZ45_13370, partial [Bacteroidia bacterium]|nr:hypothetical protein [Bacteroidia bacterium]